MKRVSLHISIKRMLLYFILVLLLQMLAEIQKTETGKKLSEAGEEALKQARAAAEQVNRGSRRGWRGRGAGLQRI